MSPGPGLDPDGMAYIGAARTLAHSGTLRVPSADWTRADSTSALSLWPPGYPAAIAIPVAAGADAIQGARRVNAAAAAVTAASVVVLVSGAAGIPAGLAAALIVFVTPAVMDVHLSVLSEPLFIATVLVTVLVMVAARDQLLLLGITAGACALVRYVGMCAPAAAVCWTLLDGRYAPGRRVRRALVVAIVPVLALGAWIARTALASDRHGTPAVRVYGGWTGTLAQARDTIATWLVPLLDPGMIRRWIAVVIALLALILVLAATRERGGRSGTTRSSMARGRRTAADVYSVATVLGACALLAVWFLVVLVASRLLVGGTIPFDARILGPVIVLLEVMTVTAAAIWWRTHGLPSRVVLAAIGLAWAGASAWQTAQDVTYAVTEGSDFAGRQWRTSPMVAWVRAHGAGHGLYSNWPPALYFYTGRPARKLPDVDEVREGDLPRFAQALAHTRGWVVGFNVRSPDVVPPDSLARLMGLAPVARFSDGTVWTLAGANARP